MIWRKGVVRDTSGGWDGVQELIVELDTPIDPQHKQVKALSYKDLTGTGQVGDAVIVTATALQRRLGTGGYAFVVAFPDRLPEDPPPGPGHIMKNRYTPFQTMHLGVDEEESDHHDLLKDAYSIEGLPVIGSDLHSTLPAVIAGIRSLAPGARVVYVMTDTAALTYQFSQSAALLQQYGWIAKSITIGQAFGADIEAVNIYTALLAARHVAQADVVIVAQGPGNLGTGSPFGFSGTALADVMHATHILQGVGVGSLRVSASDARGRHYGISHHSTTVYGRLTLAPITVVVPQFDGEFGSLILDQAADLGVGHTLVLESCQGLLDALRTSPVRLQTMGRSLEDDPSPFLAAAATGRWVARQFLVHK